MLEDLEKADSEVAAMLSPLAARRATAAQVAAVKSFQLGSMRDWRRPAEAARHIADAQVALRWAEILAQKLPG